MHRSIILQKQTKKLIEKEIRFVVSEAGGRAEGELDEGGQKVQTSGASLVAQWLRIRLPMQGTRVQALVQEDSTCHGATKPVHHSY